MASLPDLPLYKRAAGLLPATFPSGAALPGWLRDTDPRSGSRERLRLRTIFISDFHLGTPGCNAGLLLDFLKSVECETLYLVGDIIDAWRLRRKGWYWPPAHNDVVRCILKMAKRGAHVVYVPGNHDETLRDYVGLAFGDVTVMDEVIHDTADGRRLLVLHGDQFDGVVLYAKWLAFLGDSAYELLLKSNTLVNLVRRRCGLPYWSLAAHMKKRVKNAVQFISRFEEVVAHAAAERHVDGVVCGHIYSAEIRPFGGVTYYNTGDWVESCTALVEHDDGRMEVLDWAERKRAEKARQLPPKPFGAGMRIALVSDAWAPQVNGVVRTLEATVVNLRARGHEVATVTPDLFRTIPCPSYPEIRLAIAPGREITRRLAGFAPEVVHIATEGPLGWAARRWCLGQGQPFTTSFHTRFPDYVALRTGLSPRLFWPLIRRFHRPAARIMVATDRLARELHGQGLRQTHLWSRGVDLAQFSAAARPLADLVALPRPLQLYVGRVAVEKNLAAFLSADVPGTKIVVGDGPARKMLMARFPAARFLGKLIGEALARAYASADVFVFPSRTDTFGLVTVEALASGLPIAAYPVQGPLDIVGRDGCGRNGAHVAMLDDDLAVAIRRALLMDREACAAEGRLYSWDACTTQFLDGLVYAPVKPTNYSVAA